MGARCSLVRLYWLVVGHACELLGGQIVQDLEIAQSRTSPRWHLSPLEPSLAMGGSIENRVPQRISATMALLVEPGGQPAGDLGRKQQSSRDERRPERLMDRSRLRERTVMTHLINILYDP